MSNSSDRPIKVLWVAKGLGPGGMEGLLVSHSRLGDRTRFSYQAASIVDRPNSVIPQLEQLGVSCTRLGSGRATDLRWVSDLRRLVVNRQIDVVHLHSPFVAALARPALRTVRHRPKLVYTEHNSWHSYGVGTRLTNALTFPLDDAQFAVSRAAVDSMPQALGREVQVLTHGIDLDAVRSFHGTREQARWELGVRPDDFVALTVANLRTEKAYDVLLDAAKIVLEKYPNAQFLSVGQGPLSRSLEEQHDRLGLGERFKFLGFRDDVPRLLAASDAFVLSSRSEGLPLGLMEAFAMGVAPVVTSVGGMPDHVLDGSTGLLVDPESATALATAVGTVISDPELRRRLAAGARAAAHVFDASGAVAELEAAYQKVVD